MPSLNTLCVYIHLFSSTPTDSWQRHNERGSLESILCTAAVAYSLFSFRLSKMLSLLQWGQVDRWLIYFNGEEKDYFRACIARMDFYDSISDVGMSYGTHFILWWWGSSRHMPGSQKHYKRQVTVVYAKLTLSTNIVCTEIPQRVPPYEETGFSSVSVFVFLTGFCIVQNWIENSIKENQKTKCSMISTKILSSTNFFNTDNNNVS